MFEVAHVPIYSPASTPCPLGGFPPRQVASHTHCLAIEGSSALGWLNRRPHRQLAFVGDVNNRSVVVEIHAQQLVRVFLGNAVV